MANLNDGIFYLWLSPRHTLAINTHMYVHAPHYILVAIYFPFVLEPHFRLAIKLGRSSIEIRELMSPRVFPYMLRMTICEMIHGV